MSALKKTTEIVYGNSLKINKGNYEQEAPLYSAKTIIEHNGKVIDEKTEFERVRGIVDPLLHAHYLRARGDQSNHRFRVKDGKKYPSVTTILNPDPPTRDLTPWGNRGTEIHRIMNHWLRTGDVINPDPNVDIGKLKWSDIRYKEFIVKFGEDFEKTNCYIEEEVFHEKRQYSGEIDYLGIVRGRPAIVDWKTGSYKWEQLVAYCVAKSNDFLESCDLYVADLKNAEFILLPSEEAMDYWENFLFKRGEYYARFGI